MRGMMLAVAFALAALAARGAEFKLEERKYDVVTVRGEAKPLEGTIKLMDDTQVQFMTVKGIGYTWPRSSVLDVRRKCTLQESYEQATKAAGKDATAHYRLHELCVEKGLNAEALAELRKAVEVDAKYLPAYAKLLELARAGKNTDVELGTLESADRNGVASVAMQIRRSEIYARLGLIDAAEEPLKKVLSAEPLNFGAESRLAMLELVRGKAGRAEVLIQGMLRREADNTDALTALGELEFSRGNLDKAAEALGKAAAGSKSPAAAAALGAVELRRNRLDEAAKCYTQALDLDANYAPALAGRGLVLAAQGKAKEGAEPLDKAVTAEPRRADFLVGRAYVSEAAGETDAALGMYESALGLDRVNLWALCGAGRCYWLKGDAEKARTLFRQALALRADFAPARRGFGRMEISRNASEASDYLRPLSQTGEARPDDRAALAAALIRLQRFGEAAAELTKAGTDNLQAQIGLGFLAYAEGKTDDALAHFESAVKMGDYRSYASDAIQRIRTAENMMAWSDAFADHADGAEVGNGWREVEPPGTAIHIEKKRLLMDGQPKTDEALVQLARGEEANLVSITVEAEAGEDGTFFGVFVTPAGGKAVLFGRSATGEAAVLGPDMKEPKALGLKIPQGKPFTLTLKLNRANGTVRPLLGEEPVPQMEYVAGTGLSKDAACDVGLFAQGAKDKALNAVFHSVKIMRTK